MKLFENRKFEHLNVNAPFVKNMFEDLCSSEEVQQPFYQVRHCTDKCVVGHAPIGAWNVETKGQYVEHGTCLQFDKIDEMFIALMEFGQRQLKKHQRHACRSPKNTLVENIHIQRGLMKENNQFCKSGSLYGLRTYW